MLLPMLASADAVEIDGIYYNLDSEAKTAEVTSKPDRYKDDVIIPETVRYNETIYNVNTIGWAAFQNCSGLTSVTIPNSVTFIDNGAFYGCSGLTSVTIPNSVTSIGEAAFEGCNGLTSVTIPNSVTEIGDYAFWGCTSLTSITIPSSVTSIGKYSFFDCSGLKAIAVENGNLVYDSRESCKALIKTSDNELILGCMNSTIPNSVTRIGQAAFQNCKRLLSVRIPNSVVSVGQNAFYGCSGLTSVTIPNSVTSIGEAAFEGCNGLTSVTIPNSVTSIGEYVFYNCSGLTSVTIPNSVTRIGLCAFAYCSGLTSVTIPNSVTFIDNHAFQFCSGLTSITIGSGTITIGDQVFACCPELTDVYCYAVRVPYTYADSYSNSFKDSSIEYATLHVPAASVSAYQATKPWKNFKEIVALAENDTDDSDYIPFVEENKQWHVARSTSGPNHVYEVSFYIPSGIEEIYGNNYYKMTVNIKNTEFETFLLREKDRKVYIFDNDKQKEYLVFDYSLKEGDTYETYSYEEQKMVTYKVISVGDYTEGPQVKCYHDDEQANNGTTQYRYLRKWTVYRIDNESLQKTWIEGVGSLEEPLANLYDERPISSVSYLAYVQYYANDYLYLPFTINDEFGQVHGCNLPKGKEDYLEDLHHQLSYELEGDRLHVYGKAILICGSNYYALFVEEQTDDPLVHKLHFEMQGVGPSANCMGLYETDFYVSGFDPNINYIVVDNLEEEHPVINKMAYRPFVEEGKVWKVGSTTGIRDGIVKMVEYYYFEGDTIIDGKTCKQMMCQRYVSPDSPEYNFWAQKPSLSKVGAWYEEDKKVYYYDEGKQSMKMMYDFSFAANDTLQFLTDGSSPFIIGPKQTGGLEGFKGVYRDIMMCSDEGQNIHSTFWLEGVGGIDGPRTNAYNPILDDPVPQFLMACAVGDEVIYLNDEYDEEATPEGAKKGRFDFTHTIKIQPKAPRREATNEAEALLVYGEYSEKQLCIKLGPLADAYQVSITDESGKTVYGKAVNALNIVALDIDISTYAEGRYTVTVENAQESFTGEFEVQTTGIKVLDKLTISLSDDFYDLQGRKLSNSKWSNGQIRKGIYVKDGRKFVVK